MTHQSLICLPLSLLVLLATACRDTGGSSNYADDAAPVHAPRSTPAAAPAAAKPAAPAEAPPQTNSGAATKEPVAKGASEPQRVAQTAPTAQSAPVAPADNPPPVRAPSRAELGKPAPEFTLKDVDGKDVSLADYKSKTVVLEWFSPECPFCVYAYGEGPLKEMPERLQSQGIVWLAINSLGAKEKGGSPEENKAFMAKNGIKTPVLLDAEAKVGKLYSARSTPHIFIINEKGVLVYKGALDNAPFGKVPNDASKVNYVEAALTDIKQGHAVIASETKPYGCPIRYSKP